MNINKNQLLINFQNQGVTCSTVSFFGRETSIPAPRVTPVNAMLAAFEQRLVDDGSFFGRPIKEANPTESVRQLTDIADLVNYSLAHIELEPALIA